MAANAMLDQLKNSMMVRVIGGVAVLAVVGGLAAMKFMPHGDGDAPVAAVHHAARHTASAATGTGTHTAQAPVAQAAPSGPVHVTATPVAAGGRTVAQTVSHTSGEGNGASVVTAVGQPSVGNTAHLDEHLTYQYNALGRRDPFQSLVEGQFVGADVGGEAPVDPGGIKVVGIVWGANDQFALVEDVRGNSFVLRKGDKVQNGFVEGLKRDGVIVNITAEGQSQSVVIPLTRKGDQNAR